LRVCNCKNKLIAYILRSVSETVRKYPALPILNRECTKDYQIPESEFKVEKGTSIIISLMGLHRDPKYFPEPEKFDPSRFAEATKNYDETAYMPFGEGPRNCIGELSAFQG
jgi:cytochrome P450 family 6